MYLLYFSKVEFEINQNTRVVILVDKTTIICQYMPIITAIYDVKYSYQILIIYKPLYGIEKLFTSITNNLNTIMWFQVFLSNTNNL